MKNKKLLALIAALLCLSMLFVACKKKDVEPEETTTAPETTETTPVEPPVEEDVLGLDDIFNMDWKRPDPEDPLASKKTDLVVNLPVSSYTVVDNLIIYKDPNNSNIQYVYDYIGQTSLLTVTNIVNTSENYNITMGGISVPQTVYSHQKNYIYAPSGSHIAVLTVNYLTNDVYDYQPGTVYANYFNASIRDYRQDTYEELKKTTYEIKVYDVTNMSTPIQTISSNTIKSWLNTDSFSNRFYATAIKGLPLSMDSLENYVEIAADLIVYDGKIYRVDAEENLTLVREIGLTNVNTAEDAWYEKSENYYYSFSGENYRGYNNAVTVYDTALNPVCHYEVPSYAKGAALNVLNNGNVLVQYTVMLDEQAEDFDMIDPGIIGTVKSDVVTLILSVEDGKTTEIDATYAIESLETAYSADPDYANYYNADIQNIALVSYMKDGRIDSAKTACDIVSLDNDGKIVRSLKLHDEWNDIPWIDGNGYFCASTVYGTTMVMDKDGKVLTDKLCHADNMNILYMYDYTITANGIYNQLGEKVYDLADKSYTREILDYERNIVLVRELVDDGYQVVNLFNNGTVTQVAKIDLTGDRIDTTGECVQVLEKTPFGYYTKTSVKDAFGAIVNTYKYYSADGTLLATTNYELTYVADHDNVYLYSGRMQGAMGTTVVYHKFS